MFKQLCILAVPVVAVMTMNVNAAQASQTQAKAEARATIKEYKELRSICSVSIGAERKECFAKLHESNPTYRAAKKLLNAEKAPDISNVHFVSFTQ